MWLVRGRETWFCVGTDKDGNDLPQGQEYEAQGETFEATHYWIGGVAPVSNWDSIYLFRNMREVREKFPECPQEPDPMESHVVYKWDIVFNQGGIDVYH